MFACLRRIIYLGFVMLAGCQASVPSASIGLVEEDGIKVLAVESFLADIAQNVAGDRLEVAVLIPPGADPHTFQPTPQDVTRIANSQVLIINGAGLEDWLQEVLDNAGGERLVIEASQGLSESSSRPDDPHFWLDPNHVVHYVEEIRAGFTRVDPAGESVYSQNASGYTKRLQELHAWIVDQVEQIPPDKRLLVTNHESFGYFADRYGFRIVGTIVPSVSTGSSPSAQQLVTLIDGINTARIPAIFLESGTNPKLAEQVARETDVKVIEDLLTHSVLPPGGYIDLMKYNTLAIVEGLK
jgi:ABC-type Zn uptake system ZnuABC Zn-binding protein ZnuA